MFWKYLPRFWFENYKTSFKWETYIQGFNNEDARALGLIVTYNNVSFIWTDVNYNEYYIRWLLRSLNKDYDTTALSLKFNKTDRK